MDQQTNLPPSKGYVQTQFWPGVLISFLLLAGVGTIDYFTGWQTSFTLFYIAPVCTATWFSGRRVGTLFAFLATAVGLVIWQREHPGLPAALWDAGVKFGVYSIVCVLLDRLRHHRPDGHPMRMLARTLSLGAAAAAVLALVGFVVEHTSPDEAAQAHAKVAPASKPAQGALHELASSIRAGMRASRPVLLGSRDPTGPSCVSVIRSGQLNGNAPTNPGDWNGGPGTTLAMLYYFDRQEVKSPTQDLNWHQARLKTYLENEHVSNADAEQLARALAGRALRLHESAEQWATLPDDLSPIGFTDREDWPSYCLAELDRAVAVKDLPAVKRWAAELAAGTFALHDLHRWLAFLVENHLTALEFQKKCESLFVAADPLNATYDPQSTVSQFPAGVLSLNGLGNYYEIERQAERMFSMPVDRFAAIKSGQHLTPASVWIPPVRRECFLKLHRALSPANQKTFELAARTPYEHSYLVNMLYRAWQIDSADELCKSLSRFDAKNPNASAGELMGALMYRGHSFAGLEWADRYAPILMDAAADLTGSDADALRGACKWTSDFYRADVAYGVTLTLRDALSQRRLDCVRATDMIGAIFRNAGHSRFGHVRWCAETAGHSVAAYFGRTADGEANVQLTDGLEPSGAMESWPDAYFRGHAWPPTLQGRPNPYAVELYARGIDSYIWAEGYIVRGPNAGELTKAAIPYSKYRTETVSKKVFNGPYPQ